MEYQKSSVGFTTDGGPKIINLIYRLKFKINRLNQNGKPDGFHGLPFGFSGLSIDFI
jgi:hypothetical protein